MSDAASYLLFGDRLMKTYRDGDVHAVNNVTLGIRAGESVAIMGPSGSGKSTLLNLLGGLDHPDAGDIYFQGQKLASQSDLHLLRARKIGFVFQSFFLLPTLNSRENVQVPMFEGPRLAARERASKADRLLARVGMSHRGRHCPNQLSVGERQRVALARALANDPVLLLADEPTGNLDSHAAADVLDLLASLRREHNLAMIVVTHDAGVAARADRVVQFRDGQIENIQVARTISS
ncbi:MAG: ABC transporter ATP-binding protein [Gemmataceae bacterium]